MIGSSSDLLERLSRLLQNDAHAGSLKPTQWEAVRYLSRANRFSRSPSALTRYLGMTKGTVSQTLHALERKGLIEKTAIEGDRRSVNIDLTRAGAKLISEDPLRAVEAAIERLPKSARTALSGILHDLLSDMLAQRGGRPFGVCKTCRHFKRRHRRGAPNFCSLLNEPLSAEDSELICAEQEAAA